MKLSLSLLLLSVLLCLNNSMAQQRVENTSLDNLDSIYSSDVNFDSNLIELEGTFQLQFDVSSMKPLLYRTSLDVIRDMRQQSTDVYWNQSEHVSIYIPSYEKISSPNFVPLERSKYVGLTQSNQ